ncbi:MAG: zf-HC2 domain-containing protein [Planctomycetota bacterium]
MMRCEQARQLFDAYVDRELSPTLEAELGAHRLRCPSCRQELALLEVTGHILHSDREPRELSPAFTDRLLACMDEPGRRPIARLRRLLYVGGPIAAAAVIALAFLGAFDRTRPSKVAGHKEASREAAIRAPLIVAPTGHAITADQTNGAIRDYLKWAEDDVELKRRSGASLQGMFDLSMQQMLNALERSPASDDSATLDVRDDSGVEPEATEDPAGESDASFDDSLEDSLPEASPEDPPDESGER